MLKKAFLMIQINEKGDLNSTLSNHGIRLRVFFDEKIKWNNF